MQHGLEPLRRHDEAGQNIPPFGPRYIEFEQYMGGFNFADGTAQLDLQTMAFNVMTT